MPRTPNAPPAIPPTFSSTPPATRPVPTPPFLIPLISSACCVNFLAKLVQVLLSVAKAAKPTIHSLTLSAWLPVPWGIIKHPPKNASLVTETAWPAPVPLQIIVPVAIPNISMPLETNASVYVRMALWELIKHVNPATTTAKIASD